MMIRIDAVMKSKMDILARREGKTTSQVVRELFQAYIREHDMEGYIENLWGRIGKRLRSKGFGSHDIGRVIKEVREAQR